jgi:predicted DNA-binding transcriptional regulator AlpA
MSEPILGETLRNELKELIREVIREELAGNCNGNSSEKDTLLNSEQAAALMGVKSQWLYRHAAKLPFTRRISRKNLRFQEAGLRRWIAAKKPDSRR